MVNFNSKNIAWLIIAVLAVLILFAAKNEFEVKNEASNLPIEAFK